MKRLLKRVLPALLAGVLLLGCAAAPGASPAPGTSAAPVGGTGDLMAGIQAAGWPAASEGLDPAFRAAMMDFSWSLLKESAGNPGNVLISPASVCLALAMTMNGAAGDTLEAMAEALRVEGLTIEQLNKACQGWVSLLRTRGEKTELAVADSIWVREGFPAAAEFLQTNASYYDATARALDFDDPAAKDAINAWVKEQTRGAIETIVDEAIDPAAVMFLINAVYFKSDWQTPFDAAQTHDGAFNTADGPVDVKFMHRAGEITHVVKDGVQGVLLPYDEDGRYSFFALLPPEGQDPAAYIAAATGEDVAAFLGAMKTSTIALTLPKFEVRYEDSLKDELTGLGMGIAFEPAADFSRMVSEPVRDLYIGEVLHKTFCRVDEKGTEAAAVTSVEMWVTSIMEPETQIIFDRPFIYGIMDTVTGTPLFLGVLENPAA